MSDEKAVAIREYDLRGTALEHYGQRAVARELMRRLMMLHPAAKEVGESGMLAAAQLAIVVGANPMPSTNEIHIWQDRGSTTIDLGINFFRRRANELGGIYWVDDPRVMTDAEREQYGVADQDIGAIAKGCRMEKIREVMNMGMPWDAAIKGLTRVGVGTVNNNSRPKQGRPVSWTAIKGAEKDLCRALFPNFEQPPAPEHWLEVVPNGDGNPDLSPIESEHLAEMEANQQTIDAEWDAMTEDEQQAKAEQNSRILYGDPDFEGFDTPSDPTPTTRPEPDNGSEPIDSDQHAIDKLFSTVNAKTGNYYRHNAHMYNTLKKELNDDAFVWAPADDRDAYNRYYRLLVTHAKQRQLEKDQASEQEELPL